MFSATNILEREQQIPADQEKNRLIRISAISTVHTVIFGLMACSLTPVRLLKDILIPLQFLTEETTLSYTF